MNVFKAGFALALGLVVVALLPIGVHDLRLSQARGQTVPNRIGISGALVGSDGSPVAGKTVYIFVVRDNKLVLNIKEGRLANPSAETDANGRFTVEAERNYVGGGEFTVGARNGLGNLATLRRDGSNVSLTFAEGDRTGRFDVGRVTLE